MIRFENERKGEKLQKISRRTFFSPKKPIVVSGDLTFSMKWLQLTSASNASNVTDDAPVVVVTIFVYSCNNLASFVLFFIKTRPDSSDSAATCD